MKSMLVGFAFTFALICGCTAAEKVALKDCARTVLPGQIIAVAQGAASVCSGDRDCIEREAADRAVPALELFGVCVDGKLDAAK